MIAIVYSVVVAGATCLFLCASIANGFSSHVVSTTFRRTTLPSRQHRTVLSETLEVNVEKPLGIVLEENEEDMAKGVFCFLCGRETSGFSAGIRTGDVITEVDGTETSEFTFDQVMALLQTAESPVAMTLYRAVPDETVVPTISKKPAKIQPKRMPSAKKLAKGATSTALWKDPLMIGSAAFTLLFPLGIYLASKLGKS